MLAEAIGVEKIVIACGRTDLRKGIDGLAQLIDTKYEMNPFEKNVLFLFCGGRGDRIKGLLWEGNGFLLLYKRLEAGSSENKGSNAPENILVLCKTEIFFAYSFL